jgi:UDP-N-acetylglucosamine 2-epimerase (non-hydrolysing)
MSTLRPLCIVGTRPEAIKMAPIILEARRVMDPVVCFTGQHREMLNQLAAYFEIKAELNLDLMRPNQSLTQLTTRCLEGLDKAVDWHAPDCLVAQGDTTTVMVASMVAFYRRLPFVHVEAGLRTGDIRSPWPEEYNRRVAGLTADLHCAPTPQAAQNLISEGVRSEIVRVTGNTVIDALLWTLRRERMRAPAWREKYAALGDARTVLITCHRRENFGAPLADICSAILRLAEAFPDVAFVYPVHLNPNVREPVHRHLGARANIHLLQPVDYPEFVWLMDRATLILTDSGGVQEEAPSLQKPVLVMRESTERPEAVEAGAVELVGTNPTTIFNAASRLLSDAHEYRKLQVDENPYGDGRATERILQFMVERIEAAPRRLSATS